MRAERLVTLTTFAAMSLLVLAGVTFRLAGVAVPWTNELSQYCLVWLVFTGANLGIHGREHVALTLLTDRLSSRYQWAWGIVARLCFLVFCGYLGVVGFRLVAFQRAMGGTTVSLPVDVPTYVISSILPLSFLAGVVHLVRQVAEDWRPREIVATPGAESDGMLRSTTGRKS